MTSAASVRSLDSRIARIIGQVPLVPPRTVFGGNGVIAFCPDPQPLEMPNDATEGMDLLAAVAERTEDDDDVIIFTRNDERHLSVIELGYTVARPDDSATKLIPFQRVVFLRDHAAILLAKTGSGEYWQVRPWKTGAAPHAKNAVPLLAC